MKLAYWILAAIFVLFAAAQANDPDPFLWIVLYGGTAALFAAAALDQLFRPAAWVWLLGTLVWAGALLPDFTNWLNMGMPSIVDTMKAEQPWIELTREFLGLSVTAAACGWLLWSQRHVRLT
jgi:hypothetical protein